MAQIKTPKIRFKAEAQHTVGTVIRYLGKNAKFWKIIKIEDGVATAIGQGFGGEGCC